MILKNQGNTYPMNCLIRFDGFRHIHRTTVVLILPWLKVIEK